jgi:hypothetical protein
MVLRDEHAVCLLPILEKARGVPHFRTDLFAHLIGTWSLLVAWGAPTHVALGGLAHSIYSTSMFEYAIHSVTRREEVKGLIGARAENLAFLFSIMDRTDDAWSCIEGSNTMVPRPQIIRHDTKASIRVSTTVFRELALIESANIADQAMGDDGGPAPWMIQVVRWFERIDFRLPAMGALGASAGIADERAAIDKYKAALQQPCRKASKTLSETIELNPLAAEPRILRSLCAMELGDRRGGLADAKTGIRLLSTWSTPWDKRLSLSTWQEIASATVEEATREHGHPRKGLFATARDAILR